jgi:hypothetical protein
MFGIWALGMMINHIEPVAITMQSGCISMAGLFIICAHLHLTRSLPYVTSIFIQ